MRMMPITAAAQAFTGDGDDVTFDHWSIVLRQGTEVLKVRSKARNQLDFTINVDIDAEQLESLISIPKEDIWPKFTDDPTLAPHPLPNDTFLKQPSLIFGSNIDPKPREILLYEAHMCEILRRHPHPNIASYLGCVCNEGLVTGLCFVRYKKPYQPVWKTGIDL